MTTNTTLTFRILEFIENHEMSIHAVALTALIIIPIFLAYQGIEYACEVEPKNKIQ